MSAPGRTLLAVLGIWHAQAAFQNVLEILADSDVAPNLKPFASKNREMIGKLLGPLHPSQETISALVAGASAMEAAAALSFVIGAFGGKRGDLGFVLSLTLFGSFFIIDDAFDDYDLGAKHRAIFTLVAASYAASRAA